MQRKLLTRYALPAAALTIAIGTSVVPTATASSVSVASPDNAPWAQDGSNAAQSATNAREHTLTTSTVGDLKLLRTYTPPANPPKGEDGCGEGGYGQADLSGGDVTAVVNGYLVHYVAKTGQVLWRTWPEAKGSADEIAIVGNKVVVGSVICGSASDAFGFVDAYSLSTGKWLWEAPSVPECGRYQTSACSSSGLRRMLVSGDYLIDEGTTGEGDKGLAVLRASNGSIAWEDLSGTCYGAPLVVDERVIYPKCNGSSVVLVARDLSTGVRSWRQPGVWTLERGDSGTTAGRNLYAVDADGVVADLDPQTGESQGTLPGAVNVLAVGLKVVFASCNAGTDLCAYSAATHHLKWTDHGALTQNEEALANAGGVLYLDSGAAYIGATGAKLKVSFPAGVLSVGDGRLADNQGTDLQLYGLAGE